MESANEQAWGDHHERVQNPRPARNGSSRTPQPAICAGTPIRAERVRGPVRRPAPRGPLAHNRANWSREAAPQPGSRDIVRMRITCLGGERRGIEAKLGAYHKNSSGHLGNADGYRSLVAAQHYVLLLTPPAVAEDESMSIPNLTVTLSLPKINDAGWIDPDVLADWHELGPGTLDAGSEVFAAMTGGYAPKWSRFPDWEEMAAIAHQAADHYASRLGPTMTAPNGALLDYESSSDSSLDIDGLPGHDPRPALEYTLLSPSPSRSSQVRSARRLARRHHALQRLPSS